MTHVSTGSECWWAIGPVPAPCEQRLARGFGARIHFACADAVQHFADLDVGDAVEHLPALASRNQDTAKLHGRKVLRNSGLRFAGQSHEFSHGEFTSGVQQFYDSESQGMTENFQHFGGVRELLERNFQPG